MLISRKTKYAIKALQFLAQLPDQTPVLISEISEMQSIPHKFLELILLELKKNGFVQSRKGKGGGYSLAKSPEDITLSDVINTLEGSYAPLPCLEPGQKFCEECDFGEICALRSTMSEVFVGMTQILSASTIASMNRKEEELRLAQSKLIYYEI